MRNDPHTFKVVVDIVKRLDDGKCIFCGGDTKRLLMGDYMCLGGCNKSSCEESALMEIRRALQENGNIDL